MKTVSVDVAVDFWKVIEIMAEAHAFKKQSVVADKTDWPVAKVNRLIELYEAHRLLYNTRLKEYHNIHLKNEAFKTIAADLDITSRSK